MSVTKISTCESNPVYVFRQVDPWLHFSSLTETGKMKDDFGHLLDFVHNLKKLKVRYLFVFRKYVLITRIHVCSQGNPLLLLDNV